MQSISACQQLVPAASWVQEVGGAGS